MQTEEMGMVTKFVQEESNRAEELCVQAKNLNLVKQADVNGAGDWLKSIKQVEKTLEDRRKSLVKPLNEHIRYINGLFKEPMKILTETEGHIKKAILDWNRREQERIRREQEAAMRKAEAQRKRMETLARKAEEAGDMEKAEQFIEKSENIEPIVTGEGVENPSGIYTTKRWKAEVYDTKSLVVAVAKGDASLEALMPDMKYLEGLAKRLRGNVQIPGVRFYEVESLAARADL